MQNVTKAKIPMQSFAGFWHDEEPVNFPGKYVEVVWRNTGQKAISTADPTINNCNIQ